MKTHKFKEKIIKVILSAIAGLLMAQTAYAKIPEPDNIIFGLAREGTLFMNLEVNGQELAFYTMGDNPDAGDYYILRVPIDSFEPQNDGTARPGDVAYIYINGETNHAAEVTIGERGSVILLNLANDSDKDGVPDKLDKCLETVNGETVDEEGCSFTQLALTDKDNDGFLYENEIAAGSDPNNPDSIPSATTLTLRAGYNQVNFPAETLSFGHLFTLMEFLGGKTVLDKVMVFNSFDQKFMEAGYNAIDELEGENVSLQVHGGKNGLNLIIYAKSDATVNFSTINCPSWHLRPGVNQTGSPCFNGTMTAYQLLQTIGDESVVTSIQRFNPVTGKFEVASYKDAKPVGVDFALTAGQGLMIYMKQELQSLRPF